MPTAEPRPAPPAAGREPQDRDLTADRHGSQILAGCLLARVRTLQRLGRSMPRSRREPAAWCRGGPYPCRSCRPPGVRMFSGRATFFPVRATVFPRPAKSSGSRMSQRRTLGRDRSRVDATAGRAWVARQMCATSGERGVEQGCRVRIMAPGAVPQVRSNPIRSYHFRRVPGKGACTSRPSGIASVPGLCAQARGVIAAKVAVNTLMPAARRHQGPLRLGASPRPVDQGSGCRWQLLTGTFLAWAISVQHCEARPEDTHTRYARRLQGWRNGADYQRYAAS